MIIAKTYVLLIGIDDYPGPGPSPLGGCVNDIDQIQRVLIGRLGVAPADLVRLAAPIPGSVHDATVQSRPPTRDGIIAALRALANGHVTSKDKVFIYYSGHGASLVLDDANGRALCEALVPVDCHIGPDGAPRNLLFDLEVNELLRQITLSTDQVTLAMDCCHSVGATRDGFMPQREDDRARVMKIEGRFSRAALGLDAAAGRDGRGLLRGQAGSVERCVVAAACLADESAMEGQHADGIRGGYFTRAFMEQIDALASDELPSVRWGRIWRQLAARVERRRMQHPRLLGSFARKVFGGPPEDGDTGFGVTPEAERYRLDAGELAGITPGAIVGVYGSEPPVLPFDLDSEAEKQARKGALRVTEADRATAFAVLEGALPAVKWPARARVITPGLGSRLRVRLDAPNDAVAKAIQASPFLVLCAPGEAAAVTLVPCTNGDWAVTDDVHGTGDNPGEPWLVRIPTGSPPATYRSVLEHYARYIAPLELARRCREDLAAGTMELRLLDCSRFTMDDRGFVIEAGLDPQNPALDPILPGSDGFCDVVDGMTWFCYEVKNHYARPLFVTLVECGSSGRVNLSFGGQVEVPPGGRHIFWYDATPRLTIGAVIPDGKTIGIDRLVAIGTTSRDRVVDFLRVGTSFADVIAATRDGGAKDAYSRGREIDRWTSSYVNVRSRKPAPKQAAL